MGQETEQSVEEEEDEATGSASEDEAEQETPRTPRANVFGAKLRGKETTSASSTGSNLKPVRQSVKHPFKAVAATHVRLQKQFHVPQN